MKKFVLFLTAAFAAIAMATGASALHLIEDGNVAELIIDNNGDVDGVVVLEMSDGLSLARDPQSPGGALVVYNAENGRIVVAGLGLQAGDTVLRLTFEGEGTYSLTGEGGEFEGMPILTGEIGVAEQPNLVTPEPEPEPEPERPVETNPKGGVAFVAIPALAAAAVVAITRRKNIV